MMRELTLLNFNEMKYGIWRDEFHSIEDITAIHWFSPDPGYIAGMSSVNGRTVTLFDLSACLGFPPLSRSRADYAAILLPYKEKFAGFLVDFVIEGFSISEKQLFSMPAYLRTPVIKSCVGQHSKLIDIISVINIPSLFEMVLKTDFTPPSVAFQVSEIQQTTPEMKAVRIFISGGKTFAIPASSAEIVSQTPEVISKMDFLPPFIKGVTSYNEEIIPLIHLSRCMKMPEGSDGQMLVSDISGHKFGLLVDSDKGQLETVNLIVRSLPPMAKSDWLLNAIIYQEEIITENISQIIPQIIPLVDPGALLAEASDTSEKESFYHEYNPDSDFESLYLNSEVGIQEFLLSGVHYAVPQSEVEDTFTAIPYRPLPGGISMLAGIAVYHEELLPVLDLGACFGGQSFVTPKWQMILVKNGNFRALLLVERILNERLLPLTMQHQLPFGDSLSLVYGCYPDEFEVRLILNIAAMAVNFEKTSFKNFFNAFSVEDKAKPEDPDYFRASQTSEKNKSDVEPEELITQKPDVVFTPVLTETDGLENSDVLVPDSVNNDNRLSVDEENDLDLTILETEDLEPDDLEDIHPTSDLIILDESFEDANDAEQELDPQINPLEPADEVLFDTLSSSFGDSETESIPDITDTDLFEKLNKAFDSSADQFTEAVSEDLQDVITEILDNGGEEETKEQPLFQLEPEMEIIADDSVISLSEEDQVEPGDLFEIIEPDAGAEFAESDDVIETIKSGATDELTESFITDETGDSGEFSNLMEEDTIEPEELDSILESEPELEFHEISDALESGDIESELISEISEKNAEESEELDPADDSADDLEGSEPEEFPELAMPVVDLGLDEDDTEIAIADDTGDSTEQDELDIKFELPEELPESLGPEALVDSGDFTDLMEEDTIESEELDSILESEPELEFQETSDALESGDLESELIFEISEKNAEESEVHDPADDPADVLADDLEGSEPEEFPELKMPADDLDQDEAVTEIEPAVDTGDLTEQNEPDIIVALPEESPESAQTEGLVEFADLMEEDNFKSEELDSTLESEPELEFQETSDTLESSDLESELIPEIIEKTAEESEALDPADDPAVLFADDLEGFEPEETSDSDGLQDPIEEAGEERNDEAEMETLLPDYYFLKTHDEKKSKKRKTFAVFSAFLIFVLFILFYYFSRSDDPVPIREELKVHPRSASVQANPVQKPEAPMVHENYQEVQTTSEASSVKEKNNVAPESIDNNQSSPFKPPQSVDQEQSSEISQIPLPTERNNMPAVDVPLQDGLSDGAPVLSSKSPVFNQIKTAEQGITIYTVKKGDNLWTISKQYTGYGINYRSIAEENIIINPDLIFPEQQIEIRKE